jgi:hypothetical protein
MKVSCGVAMLMVVSAATSGFAQSTPNTPGQGRPASPSGVASTASDGIPITVINTMGHAWKLSYGQGTARTALGDIDAHATMDFTIPRGEGDSLTFWAVSQEMGEQAQKVPTHPTKPVVLQF